MVKLNIINMNHLYNILHYIYIIVAWIAESVNIFT